MRLRSALRRFVKWASAAITTLLLIAWLGSTRVFAGWSTTYEGATSVRTYVVCANGLLSVGQNLKPGFGPQIQRDVYLYRSSLSWWGEAKPRWNSTSRYVALPLWIPVLLGLSTWTAIWRFDIRQRYRHVASVCAKCGYDHTGLPPQSTCPECGSTSAIPTSQ